VAAPVKSHIRVVLADDHPVVRDGLAAMVNQQADMEVVAEAGDGEEAIVLYEQHRPDVRVLDLRMPKRDGVAVVQRVLEINPKACILIMTTYDGDEDIFQCLSQGAKGYLLTDAPRQEILSAIRAVSEDRPYTSSTVADLIFVVTGNTFRSPTLTGIRWALLAAFFALTAAGLFSYLRNSRSVARTQLYTAVNVYLLLGLLWAALYLAIDAFSPGSIQIGSRPADR
jgi:CheY-like chemotaxis protein